MKPSKQAWDAWISWALYAVTGKMQEADALFAEHPGWVRSVAKELRLWHARGRGLTTLNLHRGLLLEPHEVSDGSLPPRPEMSFLSFSTSSDVAAWFADPRSVVGSYMHSVRPDVRGYMVTCTLLSWSSVLFHHSWHHVPVPGRGFVDLAAMAKQHPHIAPLRDQFIWNLATQEEVLLENTIDRLAVVPISIDAEVSYALDKKLAPVEFLPSLPPTSARHAS